MREWTSQEENILTGVGFFFLLLKGCFSVLTWPEAIGVVSLIAIVQATRFVPKEKPQISIGNLTDNAILTRQVADLANDIKILKVANGIKTAFSSKIPTEAK